MCQLDNQETLRRSSPRRALRLLCQDEVPDLDRRPFMLAFASPYQHNAATPHQAVVVGATRASAFPQLDQSYEAPFGRLSELPIGALPLGR